jgi:hypothetical protein
MGVDCARAYMEFVRHLGIGETCGYQTQNF